MLNPEKNHPWLILQGLGTPFLAELARKLEQKREKVYRVNFCGGDRLFAGNEEKINFNGHLGDLPKFYQETFQSLNVKGIILFGDERAIHKPAISLAKSLGIDIFVIEEGYLRPGWITFEKNGTNANSDLPNSAEKIRDIAQGLQVSAVEPETFPTLFRRVWMDLADKTATFFMQPLYPNYKSHRPYSKVQEIKGWLKRLLKTFHNRYHATRIAKAYLTNNRPYFLLPLQLNSDTQIRIHADVAGVSGFIKAALFSFAKHSENNARLLIKNHPLDNGVINYKRIINDLCKELDITNRVDFIDGGDIMPLVKNALGTVVVNSTVGLTSLITGTPVIALGKSIYHVKGLTHSQGLDAFWRAPQRPEADLVDDLVKILKTQAMIEGDLFSKRGIDKATSAGIKILLGEQIDGQTRTVSKEKRQAVIS